MKAFSLCILCVTLVATGTSAADDAHSQGFSPERLERATRYLQTSIDQGQYAGAVTLIARNGHIVQWQGLGYRRDAIFQIYSMTKPITSAAALLLLEEGRLQLDDPVSRFLPQFAHMQVLEADKDSLRPAVRPITIRHLLTHTAGFAAGVSDSSSLADYAARMAKLPLANDPGARFRYDGASTEVLSRVLEVVAGKRFDEFLDKRIIGPLRMVDTAFSVPAAKRDRIVEMTSTDDSGRLIRTSVPGDMLQRYPSGAGGLYSTAADYFRFCQMLLNGGQLDGTVILGRKTVELMLANHLTHLSPPVNEFNDAEGFGLGGYVVLDPARRGLLGSAGQFGWSGAAATWFTIDPTEQLVAILMMQHLPRGKPTDPPRLNRPFNNLVYQALVD